MSSSYTSEAIKTHLVRRACDHLGEFTEYARDPYFIDRLAKFQRKRCPACTKLAVAELERRQAAQRPTGTIGKARVKKGTEVKLLPVGTAVSLTRLEDGWYGRLIILDNAYTATANGLMGVIQKLARQALTAKRVDTAAEQP